MIKHDRIPKVGDVFGDNFDSYSCWILISKTEALRNFKHSIANIYNVETIENCQQNEKEFLCCHFRDKIKSFDSPHFHVTASFNGWNYLGNFNKKSRDKEVNFKFLTDN